MFECNSICFFGIFNDMIKIDFENRLYLERRITKKCAIFGLNSDCRQAELEYCME